MAKKKLKKRVSRSPWFKERGGHKKGWSFIPINWKGFVALILLVGVNVFAATYFELNILDGRSWSKFGIVFLLSILVFILIARKKTQGVKDDI